MNPKTYETLEFDKIRARLADYAAFSGGRTRALALEPATDLDEVRRRQALTAEARDVVDRRGRVDLGKAHDVRDRVEDAELGKVLRASEFIEVRDTLDTARHVRRMVLRDSARWPTLAEWAEQLEGCPALYDAIQDTLDESGAVLDSASPTLRKVRRERRTVKDRLVRQLESTAGSDRLRDYLQEAIVTQRAGRYVVPVKSEFRSKVKGIVHDTSDSGATVFVEPMAVVELGNKLRELEAAEEHEIERVLRELSGFVAAEGAGLRDTVEALGVMDLSFACAYYGSALRAVTPRIEEAERPRLDFRRARHPLLDPDTVVPVDVRVGDDFRQLVITGPNTGGKTVTLKTMGLLTLMAQAGLQIPAQDGAGTTVFGGVHADIGDEQSIEQSLSTFSGHMTNIIRVLEEADDQSLVLLDELGAGTDPVEGAALATALLDHLRDRGITTVASTHYSELKVYAHETDGVANASVEFDLETLQPTYELTIGLPGRSNALAIASRLGLSEQIVDAAREAMGASELAMEDLLHEIRTAHREASEDRAAAAEARQQADEWAKTLEGGVEDLEAERARVLNAARAKARAELEEARETIAELLRQAEHHEATAKAIAEAEAALDTVEEDLVEEPEPEPTAPTAPPEEELRPGVYVRVQSVGQAGEVLRVDDGEAEVQLGRMRMTVPTTDLELTAAPEPESAPGGGTRVHRAADQPEVSNELDLRGVRVAEGLRRLDDHLDSAVLQGLPWVRVIHGHGTGAMKEAVREAVRHHPQVTRHRRGERGEGGDGVTVVYVG